MCGGYNEMGPFFIILNIKGFWLKKIETWLKTAEFADDSDTQCLRFPILLYTIGLYTCTKLLMPILVIRQNVCHH